MSLFKKAVKSEAKLRLAIAGPSGSGKTYSALAIATALGGPIAYVDTEHGSASKYADLFDFDVAEMHAPYHPDKYVAAIREAAQAGYKIIVLDSLSHAWNGEGGLLELVEDAAKRMKTANTYAAWKDVTPIQNRMIEAIVSSDIHIIGTMRSKQDYVQEKNDKGYTVIRKVGMAPVQRDGFEYEFDVFFDMDYDNNAIVSKSRCPALSGQVIAKPGAQVAKVLKEWLGSATAQEGPGRTNGALQIEASSTPRNTAQKVTVETDGDVLFERENTRKESPPHQRLFGIGLAVFGEDWNNGARPWIIGNWTVHVVQTKLRTSASDLNDDEKDLLADYIKAHSATLIKKWHVQKAEQLAAAA